MARITIDKFQKKYGDVNAVLDLSFEVADGEFLALLGPSGCGKSSTMRSICGLEGITAGTISFDGKPMNDVRPRDRNVAMSFETYALYPTLSVYENIAFPLRSANWSNQKVDEKVKEIAHRMELEPILDSLPGALSSGQAQRVGLARALVREPSVFLLDEPISHLDTRQRHRMREFIKHMHAELKYTMIYVTHDQEEAMALADRIVVMHEGIVRQIGTPDEVYNNPADDFVAGFVGEPAMNFIEGEIAKTNGKWVFQSKGQDVTLPGAWQSQADRLPKRVKMAIRPFYVDLSLDPGAGYDLAGEVFLSENLQDYVIVNIDVADLRIQAVTQPSLKPERHQAVYLKFNPNYIRLFDLETGKAIRV